MRAQVTAAALGRRASCGICAHRRGARVAGEAVAAGVVRRHAFVLALACALALTAPFASPHQVCKRVQALRLPARVRDPLLSILHASLAPSQQRRVAATTDARAAVPRFVTNKSQEGSQFCRGFGGIGGILRYQVDLREFDVDEEGPDGGNFYSDDSD